jgi:rubrerythrin
MEARIDWERLSAVEMASGIEVLYVARLLRTNKSVHKKILEHCIDEYRHSRLFREYAQSLESSPSSQDSTCHQLLSSAGLENSALDRTERSLLRWVSYVFVGEFRAIEFNTSATKSCSDPYLQQMLAEIEKDELGHAAGVQRFLKANFSPVERYLSVLRFRIRYRFQRFFNGRLLTKLQDSAGQFLIPRIISKFCSTSIFQVNPPHNRLSDMLNSKTRLL